MKKCDGIKQKVSSKKKDPYKLFLINNITIDILERILTEYCFSYDENIKKYDKIQQKLDNTKNTIEVWRFNKKWPG